MNQSISNMPLDASLNAEAFYLKHSYQVVEKSFHTLQTGLQMPCVKMIKRFSKASNINHPQNGGH